MARRTSRSHKPRPADPPPQRSVWGDGSPVGGMRTHAVRRSPALLRARSIVPMAVRPNCSALPARRNNLPARWPERSKWPPQGTGVAGAAALLAARLHGTPAATGQYQAYYLHYVKEAPQPRGPCNPAPSASRAARQPPRSPRRPPVRQARKSPRGLRPAGFPGQLPIRRATARRSAGRYRYEPRGRWSYAPGRSARRSPAPGQDRPTPARSCAACPSTYC